MVIHRALVSLAVVALTGCGAARTSVEHPQARGWSGPLTLEPATIHTSAPQLDLAPDGTAIAAWYEGRPPVVRAGALEPSAPIGIKVVVDLGSVTNGFGRPLVLSGNGNGTFDGLKVAASGPRLAFVAWSDAGRSVVNIAVLRDGRPSTVHTLHDATPAALTAVGGGRVAVVWNQYGHGFPVLQYALMDEAGHLGPAATIVHFTGRDSAKTQISINDRGELVAAWGQTNAIDYLKRGTPFTAARLFASVCEPAGQCTGRREVTVARTRVACIDPAVALSQDGTVTVVAAANDPAPRGCAKSIGVWGGVARRGQTLAATSLIAPAGDQPVAAPAGHKGALAIFNPGGIPHTTLAWSTLTTDGRFSTPAAVKDSHTINAPVLAANTSGQFVAAWTHAFGFANAPMSLRAASGRGQSFGAPHTIVPARGNANTFAAGIDGRGDALVLWNTFHEGGAANGPSGMYASILR